MRTALVTFCIGTLLFACSASAEEATGRVRGVYYEAARGVLVDAKMLRRPSAIRWVDVELTGDHPPERKRQLVQLPSEMNAAVGDVVAVQLGEPKSTQLAQILPAVAVNRAIKVDPQAPQFAGSASTGASTVKSDAK
jgi:hypothetical protein